MGNRIGLRSHVPGVEDGQHGGSGTEPAPSLIAVTLGAMSIAAGVIAVLGAGATVALTQVTAEGGCATAFNVAHGLAMGREHARGEALAIGRAGLAETVRDLEHGSVS